MNNNHQKPLLTITERSSKDEIIGAAMECQAVDALSLKLYKESNKDFSQKQRVLFILLIVTTTCALLF
tara:strand:+ start:86 stop:289 length:204 start_codon:yes stop_codon:yes gene_type:complete